MTLPLDGQSGRVCQVQAGKSGSLTRKTAQAKLVSHSVNGNSRRATQLKRPSKKAPVSVEVAEQLFGDLSPLQRTFVADLPTRHSFAAISWGCAATKWLALVLNAHPDIFCVHAANVHWSAMDVTCPLDGLEYLRIIAAMGAGYPVVGDVHGIARHHVPRLRKLLKKQFNACVLIREPMARLKSQLALFQKYQQFQAWDVAYVDALLKTYRITLPARDYESRLFVHGVNMLNAIEEERQVGKVYRSEDFTSNTGVLGELIDDLTCGTIRPEQSWLLDMVEKRRINCHVGSRPVRFQDWQMDVIKKLVREEAWDNYMSLGYAKPPFIL